MSYTLHDLFDEMKEYDDLLAWKEAYKANYGFRSYKALQELALFFLKIPFEGDDNPLLTAVLDALETQLDVPYISLITSDYKGHLLKMGALPPEVTLTLQDQD